MKKAILLSLCVMFAYLFCFCPVTSAGAYDVRLQGRYWGADPIEANTPFVVKISYYVLPNDGVIASVSGRVTATAGISITGFAGAGANSSAGNRFSFSGNRTAALGIDIKAGVRDNATENESITIQSATVKLKNGEVFTVPGMTIRIPVSVPQPHTHTMQEISRTDATCTVAGEVVSKCTGCEYIERKTLPAKGHSYGETITTAATCEQDGERYQQCSVCRYKHVTETLSKTGHQWKLRQSEASTCSKRGWMLFVCKNTGCSAEKTEESPIADHAFAEEALIQEATCTEDGKRYRRCAWCGTEDVIETWPRTGHRFLLADMQPATCEAAGWEHYVCQNTGCPEPEKTVPLAANGHPFGDEITKDASCEAAGKKYRLCNVCQKEELLQELPALKHSFVLAESEASDCLHCGWELYRCERSGCMAEQRKELPIGKHSFGANITEEATCEAAGRIYRVCSVCKVAATLEKLPATGHDFVKAEREESTCVKRGFQMYRCGNDGCTSTKKDVFPFSPHAYGPLITVLPTCETEGKNYRVCSACKGTTDERKIAALGHAYAETNRMPSTCTKEGTAYFVCERAGCSSKKTEALPRGDHQYSAPVTRRTDCELGAEVYRVCGGCGSEKLVDTLPPMAHDFVEENRQPSTCITHGHAYLVCSRQGCTAKTERELPFAEHDFRRKTEKPLCEQDGQILNACSVCGRTELVEELSALGHSFVLAEGEASDCLHCGWELYRCERSGCMAEQRKDLPIGKHSFGANITEKATCEAAGRIYRVCSVCKAAATQEKLPATGHDYVKAEREESTCVKRGFQMYRCGNEGCTSTKKDVLPFSGHAYGPLITVLPTCETAGKNYRVCSACKGTTDERKIAALGHAYIEKNRTPSTCTKEGTVYFACERAGCSSKKTEALPLGDHQYGAPVTRRTDCELGAEVYRVCGGCGSEKLVDTLPPMAHDFVEENRQPSTCKIHGQAYLVCSRQGCTAKTQRELPFAEHDFRRKIEKPLCEQGGQILNVCSVCGKTELVEEIPALGHSFVLAESQASDCLHRGWELYRCERLGCTAEQRKTLSIGGHSFGAKITEEATCEAAGRIYRVCSVCKVAATLEKLPATGHDFVKAEREESTCVKRGFQMYRCGNEGCTSTKKDILPFSGHAYGPPITVLPTCETEGKNYRVCSACKGTTDERKIAALGHAYIEKNRTPSTCTKEGTVYFACERAGCSSKKTETLPRGDHQYGAPVTRRISCELGAEVYRVCGGCGHENLVETLPPMAHDFVEEGRTPSTCTTQGEVYLVCSRQGCTAKTQRELPLAGHDFRRKTEKPLCEQDGRVLNACSVCGRTELVEELSALGHSFILAESKASDCLHCGWELYRCERSGCMAEQRKELPIGKHSFGANITEKAACEAAGRIYRVCSVCKAAATLEKLPATGHDFVKAEREESTCVKRGFQMYRCGNEGCTSTKKDVLPFSGHAYGPLITVLPTCETEGRNYRVCSACKGTTDERKIAALGHAYIEKNRTPSTCTKEGTVYFACERVGCSSKKTETLPQGDHQYGAPVTRRTDCELGAEVYRVCGGCGKEKLVETLPPVAHDFVEEGRTPSTCTTQGEVYLVCSRQGCTAKTQRKLPLAAHRFGGEITSRPSCEQEGEVYRLCGICGEKRQMRVFEKLGHQYGRIIEETPTCTHEGRRYQVCERCGDERQTEALKAPGHSWGEWRPEEGFDCEKGGQYIRHCAVCPAAEQRGEAPKRHLPGRLRLLRKAACIEDGEMGTVCLVCQKVTYSVAVKAPGHRFEAWARPDSVSCKTGWQEQSACAVCGAQGTRQIAVGEHQFAPWSVTRAASCTQKGERLRVCTVCHLNETEEIPMKFHALSGPRIIRHPTCEQAGETGLFCRDCGYAEQYPLAALGHDWGKLSVPEGADCAAGWTGVRICQRENCKATREETVQAGDHRFGGWMIDQMPVCMQEGVRRHVCELCGAAASEALPALGHRFGTPALTKRPTCETAGESQLVCTVCGHTEVYPLAALEHDWRVSGTVPATCTEKGQAEHQCSRCQKIKTEDIPAAGHQPGAWETVREAFCGVQGQRKTICLVCSEAMAEAIPALEHSFRPWGIALPSACEKEGEEARECARCGFRETRVLPAGRHQLTLWTEEKPATCAGKGVYHRACEVCGLRETMYTDAKPHVFGAWQKAEYTDCTQGGIQRRACGVCGQEEERPTDKLHHWMGAWQTVQQATCEKEGIRERACKRCGVKEAGSIAATGHKAARKYTIVRKARAYHPGIREKLCSRCGAVLQKQQYSPSLQSMKVVFNPAGIPLKELLPGSTNQWYRLIPVDIRKPGVYTYPLVADGRHTVGDMTVTVNAAGLTVSCAYPDDRTVVFRPMLRVFSSLEEITPARIRRRVKGYALDKPISFSRFANADTLYLYLRIEGVYDDQRALNVPFDAQSPGYLSQKEALLRMVPAR